MSALSHMQIVDAITEIAAVVMPAVLAEDKIVHADSTAHAETQLKVSVIEVLKQPGAEPLGVDQSAQWPDLLLHTSRHNRLIFIALVRAIYR